MRTNKVNNILMQIYSLPSKIYAEIKRCFQIVQNYFNKRKNKKTRVFLIGTPQYGNLGDQLIALAEIEWLKKYYKNFELLEYTHENLTKDKKCRLVISNINKNDLIFLQGGGNVNDLYLNCEAIRRRIIYKCKNNNIVLFPQSISYSNSEKSNLIKTKTQEIYNSNKNLTVIAREKTSHCTAKKMFPDLQVLLCPDMATFLFNKITPSVISNRSGIVMLTRKDGEKYYTEEQFSNLIDTLNVNYNLDFSDTNVFHTVTPADRLIQIKKLVDSISKYQVVITDRFHGVIFSILSGTPCIALRSFDHKIIDGCKWFEETEGIYYADSIENVPDLVKKAINQGHVNAPDFSNHFENLYNILNQKH